MVVRGKGCEQFCNGTNAFDGSMNKCTDMFDGLTMPEAMMVVSIIILILVTNCINATRRLGHSVMIGAPHRLARSQVAPRPFAMAAATEALAGGRSRATPARWPPGRPWAVIPGVRTLELTSLVSRIATAIEREGWFLRREG